MPIALPDEVTRRAFIRANTRLLAVPHAPEIRLHLADEATELWRRTEVELQALARHILDHPDLAGSRPGSVLSASPRRGPAPAFVDWMKGLGHDRVMCGTNWSMPSPKKCLEGPGAFSALTRGRSNDCLCIGAAQVYEH